MHIIQYTPHDNYSGTAVIRLRWDRYLAENVRYVNHVYEHYLDYLGQCLICE